MSMDGSKEPFGAGKSKVLLGVAGNAILGLLAGAELLAARADSFLSFSPQAHALCATLVLAVFVVYVMIDMIKFPTERWVAVVGVAALAISVYWWTGVMARHNIPAEPILPATLQPRNWAYLLMAAGLSVWAFWDIQEAWNGEVEDKKTVFAGGALLVGGIAFALFMTLRLPAGTIQ